MSGMRAGAFTVEEGFKRSSRVLCHACILCAALLMVSVMIPRAAYAYLVRDPVGVSLGESSVQLTEGDTKAVSCIITPTSESQLPGCLASYCPEGCGLSMGCLDANGWCQCAGGSYVTYQTSVMVISSDPSVARAIWNDGVLEVNAYSAGTVSISLTASLRSHSPDTTASLTVTVDLKPEENQQQQQQETPPATEATTSGTGGGQGGGSGSGNVENASNPDATGSLNVSADSTASSFEEPGPSGGGADVVSESASPAATVKLMELQQTPDAVEDDQAPQDVSLDARLVGVTGGAGVFCLLVGALLAGGTYRKQLS